MRFPSKEVVEQLLKEYMDDKFAPPIGTQGTVRGVDDAGSILVKWSNESSISVVYGEDVCRKLDESKEVQQK